MIEKLNWTGENARKTLDVDFDPAQDANTLAGKVDEVIDKAVEKQVGKGLSTLDVTPQMLANLVANRATKQEMNDAIAALIDNAPEAYNTFKEFANYIATDGQAAAAMSTAIQANATALGERYTKEEVDNLLSALSGNAGEAATTNTVRAGYINDPLRPWREAFLNDPTTAKMVGIGDSTWDTSGGDAVGIPIHIKNNWIQKGQPLEGFNFDLNYGMFGRNGQTLEGFLAGNDIDLIVAFNPSLILFGYGINDVRISNETIEQMLVRLRPMLRLAVQRFRERLPDASIVLVQPSPFLSVNPIGFYNQGSFASVAEAAQGKSEALYRLYAEMQGEFDNTLVDMQQDSVFGRLAIESHPLMHDEIHRRHWAMLNQLVKLIGVPRPFNPSYASEAIKQNYIQPWAIYPRATEDEGYFDKIISGEIIAQGANYLDIGCNAKAAASLIRGGDVVTLGRSFTFRLNSGANVNAVNDFYLRITGIAVPANSVGTPAEATVYRHRFGFNQLAEQYLLDKKNYPYRRLLNVIASANGYAILSDPTQLENEPYIDPANYALKTTDVLVSSSGKIIPLTGATFQDFNGTPALRINGPDFSDLGPDVFIFGNHEYENSVRFLGQTQAESTAPTHSVLAEVAGVSGRVRLYYKPV